MEFLLNIYIQIRKLAKDLLAYVTLEKSNHFQGNRKSSIWLDFTYFFNSSLCSFLCPGGSPNPWLFIWELFKKGWVIFKQRSLRMETTESSSVFSNLYLVSFIVCFLSIAHPKVLKCKFIYGNSSLHLFAAAQPNYCHLQKVIETKRYSRQRDIYVSFYAIMKNKGYKVLHVSSHSQTVTRMAVRDKN